MKHSLSFPTEATANGHGNENSFDAGRIAVCESWAEHIGMSFAHKTYGGNNSITINNVTTYQIWLESQRNEELNHIPIGYYQDLIDGINTSETSSDFDDLSGILVPINDGISGLSNAQLFSLLNPSINSVGAFTNSLTSSSYIQSPNTTQGVSNLFNSY